MRHIPFLIAIIITLIACEKDRMENYRIEFSGGFLFHTVIRDENKIIDTVDYEGIIEPVYSNLTDIIYIRFTPALIIDPILKEDGRLEKNTWWSDQGVPMSIAGAFRDNKESIVFSYMTGTEQKYILYQVSGQRIK